MNLTPLIRVTAAVIKKDDRVLIARRGSHKDHGGKWEFPGGKIEDGETPEECLKRELAEEFQIEVEIGKFICKSTFLSSKGTIELLAYETSYLSGEFQLTDHDQILWIELNDYQRYDFTDADIPILEYLLRKKQLPYRDPSKSKESW